MKSRSNLLWLSILTFTLACEERGSSPQDTDQQKKDFENTLAPQRADEKRIQAVKPDPEDQEDNRELVRDAERTLEKMKTDPGIEARLTTARGVLIIPEYGRGAAVVGGRGGDAILLKRQENGWSGPMFYDLGGISVGAQAGAEKGQVALLLMTDQAFRQFERDDTFSLNAGARLTLADYSVSKEKTVGEDKADVLFWSSVEGAFAGVALGVTGVEWDVEDNRAYYGPNATRDEIFSGKAKAPVSPLEKQLPTP